MFGAKRFQFTHCDFIIHKTRLEKDYMSCHKKKDYISNRKKKTPFKCYASIGNSI